MQNLFKKIIIGFGTALVLGLILLGSGLLYLNTPHALNLIENSLNRQINGEISIEKLHLAIFQGQLELQNCVLKGAGAGQLAGFKFLRVKWSWQKLLERVIQLNIIIIKEPWIKVKINKQGELDLAEALQATSPQQEKTKKTVAKDNPWNIIIDDLKLDKGKVSFISAPNSMQAKLQEINLSGKANFLLRQGELVLNIGQAKIKTPGISPFLQQINLKANFDKNRLAPISFRACLGKTCFSLKGRIARVFSMPEFDLIANISGDLTEIQKKLQLPANISGKTIMYGKLKGSLENPAATIEINYSGGKLWDFPVGKAVASLTLNNKLLILNRFNASIAGGKIDLAGQSDLKAALSVQDKKLSFDLNKVAYNFDLKAKNLQTGKVLSSDDLAGTVSGALSLKGAGLNPETLKIAGRLKLTADEVVIKEKNHPLNFKLDANLQINKGIIDLTELRASVKETFLTAKGTCNFKAKTFLSDININAPDLNQILSIFQIQGVVGGCKIAAKLSGSLQQPNANLLIEGYNLSYKDQYLEKLQIAAILIDKKIIIEQVQADLSAQEKILGSGWITSNRQFAFNMVSDGIYLKTVDPEKKLGIEKGQVFLRANGHGSIDNPLINGTASLKHLFFNGKAIDDFNLSFALNDHQAKITGRLNFDLNGFYDLKTKDFKADFLFQDTDMGTYLAAAGRKDLSGRLTGKIKATGNADHIGDIKAKTDLSDIKLLLNNRLLLDSNGFKANFQNKTFSILQGKFSLLQDGWLTLSGKAKSNGPLDISLKGRIPLKTAYLFIKESEDIKPEEIRIDELEGNLCISATIEGRVKNPKIQAVIDLEKVGMLISGLEQSLEGINGTILLTPRQLEIKKAISGQMDKGSFELTGFLEMAKWQPQKADFLLTAHKIPVEVPDLLDLVFNTSLSIKGTNENPEIKGKIVLLDGTYYKDVKFNLLEGVGQKKRKFKQSYQNHDQSILNNLKLDIILKSHRPFKVDNNLAFLNLSPDLHLTGTAAQPLISGRARVNSGKITYQKKDFIVRKGVVDFVDPYRLAPDLDILSDVKVRTWIISLKVSGTPENLLLTLSSDPPEEDGDILSLLLFGKTSQELIAGKSGGTQSTRQLLAELIAGTMGKDIKKAAGIDILEVETTEVGNNDDIDEQESDPDRVKITMGKKLSRRLTIKYAVESKNGELNQRAISEYKFSDQILFNGFQDNRGIYGGGLIFRIEFR